MYLLQHVAPFPGYRNLILDVDGTCVEGPRFFFSLCKTFIEDKLGRKFRYPDEKIFQQTLPRTMAEILQEHRYGFNELKEFAKFYKPYYRKHVRLFPWVKPLVIKASQRYSMAICSNNDRDLVVDTFEKVIWMFPAIHCRSDSAFRKPLPEFYRELDIHGISLWDSIYVTDEFLDAYRARQAGMADVVMVPWGHSTPEEVDFARRVGITVASSVEELYRHLELQA